MQMTEGICKRFKRNGCYKEHIAILAQLNAVDACVIEKILHKNGLYDNRRTLRNKRKCITYRMKQKEQDTMSVRRVGRDFLISGSLRRLYAHIAGKYPTWRSDRMMRCPKLKKTQSSFKW